MVLRFHMYLMEWWMAGGWWLTEEMLRRWVGTWVWAVLLVRRSRNFPSGHRQPLEDFFFLMFDRLYFFRVVLDSQQYWREDTDISHIHPALTYAQPPSLSTSHTRGAQMMNLHWHILILQFLPFVLGVTLNVYPVDKFMMAYTYDCSIQCNFTALMLIAGCQEQLHKLGTAWSVHSLCMYLCGPMLSRCLAHSRCSITLQ